MGTGKLSLGLAVLGTGTVVFFLVMGLSRLFLGLNSYREERLAVLGQRAGAGSQRNNRSLWGQRLSSWAAGTLDQVGVPLVPLPAPVVVGVMVVGGFALAVTLFKSYVVGVAGGLGVGMALFQAARRARVYLQKKIGNQLEEGLLVMISSLKAGASLLQAVERAAQEVEEPLATGLKGVVQGYRAGVPLTLGLREAARRLASEDIEYLATALEIYQETGGNPGRVLSNLAASIRQRRAFQGELAAKTAEARTTVGVLALSPVFLALYFTSFQPGMVEPLFTDPVGKAGLVYAALSWGIGVVVVTRLARWDEEDGA